MRRARPRRPQVLIAHSLRSPAAEGVQTLLLQQNEFGDEGVAALASSLAMTAHLGRCQLVELNLNDNGIGDIGALCSALVAGAMPNLQMLKLRENRIADLAPLARVVECGALSSLRVLLLGINYIEDAGLVEVAAAMGRRGAEALPRLGICEMQRNRLAGDAGLEALASAVSAGALAELRELYLFDNDLGEPGKRAFEAALAGGGCPRLLRHVL